MSERISSQDLALLQSVGKDAQLASREAQLAQAQVELTKLRLFLRYGLKDGDTFDSSTGFITRYVLPGPSIQPFLETLTEPTPGKADTKDP